MSRRAVAVLILLLWGGVLGWHVKREYFPPEAEQLEEAARVLPPGVAYYRVLYRGRHLGWARSEVDTVGDGQGFRITNHLALSTEPMGLEGRFQTDTRARLGRRLGLKEFSARGRGAIFNASLEGRVLGDSLITAVLERDSVADTLRVSVDGPVILSTALPLRLAAEPDVRPGRKIRVNVFDPRTLSTRSAAVRIVDAGLRSFPDSARRAGPDAPWEPARRDTVWAWKVERSVADFPLEAWFGENGRLVEASFAGSFRLERTAFELAFYGREGTR